MNRMSTTQTETERAIRRGICYWSPYATEKIARDAGVPVAQVREFIAAQVAIATLPVRKPRNRNRNCNHNVIRLGAE